MSIRIALVGASGRMGAELLAVSREFPEIEIASAMVSQGSAMLGKETSLAGLSYTAWCEEDLSSVAGVIDFSTPMSSLQVAESCAAKKIALLIGTTGFSQNDREQLKKFAEKTPILLAPNTSVGVSVLSELSIQAQRMLGDDFDIEISEIHHREKQDAPSGTARALADRLIAEGELKEKYHREGKRNPRELGISSLRGGGVFGEHTIYFLGNGERIEITHRAESRSIFARGAYKLFSRLQQQKSGLYSVRDLLSNTLEHK